MKYDIENIRKRNKNVSRAKKIIDVIIIILLYNIMSFNQIYKLFPHYSVDAFFFKMRLRASTRLR